MGDQPYVQITEAHDFRDGIPDAPESIPARKKMRDFHFRHLGM